MSAATDLLEGCLWQVEPHHFDNISVKVSLIGQRHTSLRTHRFYLAVRLRMQEPGVQDVR
jgi:hypothetical protein